MKQISRRGFFAGGAVTAGLLGLAACGNQGPKKGNGYKETKTDFGYTIVTQEGGKQLSYSPDSGLKLIEMDGFAFKDFEGTGELVPYEDWRLSAEERAEDLASRISIEQIVGLMCFSMHQRELADDNSVNDEQKAFLDGNVRAVLNAANGYPAFRQADWANKMQAYVEGSKNKIPINFSSDPRMGKNAADWPQNLALAASFDPELAKEAAKGIRSDLRKMGIATFLAPQVDIAADPRWARFSGTFGEDPALARDMTQAYIDGVQSSYDEKGEDLGWGTDSVVAMVKHWPAEGAGEGGREGHTDGGKFAVYPGKNFDALTIPFVDGAFKLKGKTGAAGSIMTSYTIAYDKNNEYGDPVGSGFSQYKVAELLRNKYNFQGAACTDWAVLNDVITADQVKPGQFAAYTCWGLEDGNKWDPAKRASRAVEVGVDQMGGWNDPATLMTAYDDMVKNLGEKDAEKNFRASAKRLLLGYFNTGLFDDPYVDVDKARAEIDKAPEDTVKAALDAQVKGIVMLKNHGNVIKKAEGGKKPKAYIPYRFTPAYETSSSMGPLTWQPSPAMCDLPLSKATLEKYFDVVTDKLADTLTGPAGKDGAPTPDIKDLTRATKEELAGIDMVVVVAAAPINQSSRRGQDKDGKFIPLSLQYRPYTADNEFVRKESIAGDTLADGTKENRSYFGRSSMIGNEMQLDQILDASKLAKELGVPCVVVLDIMQPMCVHEFEKEVDAIVVSMSSSSEAACRIVSGQDEPSALLPMQMPKDMLTVEKQLEDVPRDMDPYVDVDGNSYDFGFGLNWSGKIEDDRTKKYCVEPLTKPEA